MIIIYHSLFIASVVLMYALVALLIYSYMTKKPINRALVITIFVLAVLTLFAWGYMRNFFLPFWA